MTKRLMPAHILIDHRIRRHFGLSINEYVLAYIIDNLSNNTRYPWCLATRNQLGEMLEVSRRTTITLINSLEKKGLIERDGNNSLRTSEKWIDAFNIVVEVSDVDDEADDEAPVQNLHTPASESSSLIQNDGVQNLHTTPIYNKPPDSNLNVKPLTVNGNAVNGKPDTVSSKNAIVPLTDLERWEMAKALDVPLWCIKEVDKQFWEYIEDPKNRKKYKTSYKTIRRWVEMKLSKGQYEHCNEVEKMQLDNHHPDKVAELLRAAKFAREHKIIE